MSKLLTYSAYQPTLTGGLILMLIMVLANSNLDYPIALIMGSI